MTVQYGHLEPLFKKAMKNDMNLTDEEAFVIAMKEWWQLLGDAPGLRYAVGQIERSETTERLHGQIYTEWKSPIRGKTLAGRYPCSVKARWADRSVCRAYHKKTETRVEVLGEFGEWRSDEVAGSMTPKLRAIQYIVRDGLSAKDIAEIDPECYFTHHRSINELIAARQKFSFDNEDE